MPTLSYLPLSPGNIPLPPSFFHIHVLWFCFGTPWAHGHTPGPSSTHWLTRYTFLFYSINKLYSLTIFSFSLPTTTCISPIHVSPFLLYKYRSHIHNFSLMPHRFYWNHLRDHRFRIIQLESSRLTSGYTTVYCSSSSSLGSVGPHAHPPYPCRWVWLVRL